MILLERQAGQHAVVRIIIGEQNGYRWHVSSIDGDAAFSMPMVTVTVRRRTRFRAATCSRVKGDGA
jgi:hypothetical protein